ncbi:MAG: UDP-N-acetylmuramate--L-alanine ligase [bacterium]|nr:UDP-N-acetylmuramate--L-alanine ligase [bacterium]MCM1375313.1 UDP-N-acetylmuramate--L-alanine ligase [Muribaculum sp.]MCM1409770.1 UDP-N-acetylmuramate--L-alanine ligase [Lachnospiraceae bacterium]
MYQIDFNHPVSVYFIGIGGISMSGLAQLLHQAGFTVSGSDWRSSPITQALERQGIQISYGEDAAHVPESIDCAVLTSAVHEDNLEFMAIRQRNIPFLSRAQLLGQIMKNYELPIAVSGTHGKTTTTSMLAEILLRAGTDPTLSIGGILKSISGNMRVGKSGYFLTEADEYTNSFLSFFPKIGVILNVEEDHPDFFKDLAAIRRSFRKFAELLPEDGILIINGEIRDAWELTQALPCRTITYGRSQDCDYYADSITYDAEGNVSFVLHVPHGAPWPVTLSVPGDHNVCNAMAAIATADLLSIDREIILTALKSFHGTDRRFEYKGNMDGVTIIDDYAHHPTEITATLKAAQNYPHKTLWCVFQPHTYSRVKAFMPQFAQALTLADRVVLTDIYAAREKDTLGISSRDLQEAIQKLGGACDYCSSFEEAENFLRKNCIKDDLLITMGAGDVYKIGESLLGK